MAVISAFTLIRAISLFHLTAAYFLLTNPKILSDNNLVVILGEAMQVPHATTITSKPTESTALSALLLLFLALSDLAASSLPTRSSLEFFSAITPLRLLVLFALTIWIYFFSAAPTSPYDPSAVLSTLRDTGVGTGKMGFELFKNSLIFSIGFVEACTWFWVYTLVRDERREFLVAEAIDEAKKEEIQKERLMFGR